MCIQFLCVMVCVWLLNCLLKCFIVLSIVLPIDPLYCILAPKLPWGVYAHSQIFGAPELFKTNVTGLCDVHFAKSCIMHPCMPMLWHQFHVLAELFKTQAGPAQAHVANKTWRVTNKIVALLPHCSFLQVLLHLILTPHLVQVCSACVWVNSYCCHSYYSFIVMGGWDGWSAGNAQQQDSNATWDSKASWPAIGGLAELQAPYAKVTVGPVAKCAASHFNLQIPLGTSWTWAFTTKRNSLMP